ncbi:DUF2357 domain-containing protein [Mesorhizobium sp. M6A.T.Cr.TU.016.01.1.1]|nr:DUF2357 domain-containing protein [Mesorhizobium sp. M6A.T.Cr.TU.016.01.1.1]
MHIWPGRDPTRAVRIWPDPEEAQPGLVQEAKEHLFVLTGAPGGSQADLFIDELPLEALRAPFPDGAIWRWSPGFHAGAVECRLKLPDATFDFPVVTDPAERKLTRDAFDVMVREVLEDTFALFALSAFRKGIARGAGRRPPPIARLEFLRSRLPRLVQTVNAINARPRRILRAEDEVTPAHRATRATAPEVLKSFRSGRLNRETGPARLPVALRGHLPAIIRRKVRRSSLDISEHRQMKASLEIWARWLEDVGAVLRANTPADAEAGRVARVWAVRSRRMARQLRGLLALPLFESVVSGHPRPDASPVWKNDPQYRRFAALHRDMSLGIANVFGDFLQMPLARTFDLYELWAYLRLVRAAVDRYGAEPVDVAGLFEAGQGVTLAAGQAVVRLPKAGFSLCFQRRYREFWVEKDRRGSFSREMRPDVAIEPIAGADDRLIVLDAKYRIGSDLNDALASAHMYRDALVAQDIGGGVRRMVSAAYLLSPDALVAAGDWRSTPMPGRLFHPDYRSEFRLGAVSLTPGMSTNEIASALDTILRDAGGEGLGVIQ